MIRLVDVQKVAGYWDTGGNVFIAWSRKPTWWKRFNYFVAFGWLWRDEL